MEGMFLDQVALVTGAGSGIGRASAMAFAREGASVVVADVSSDLGEETVELIHESGGRATFMRVDVSKSSEVQALMRQIMDAYGRLDYAHNNAGVEGVRSNTVECTEENWDRVVAINLKGVWLCMKYEIPMMLQRGGGIIVNTSSVAGLVGTQGVPAYVATKHAIIGLTKTAALEYARQNIRVNAVCPGVIHTPMIDRLTGGDAEIEAAFADGEPIGRMGRPDEVAEAVIWLCSARSSFVTGHAMVVDGGRVAQ